MAYIGNQPALQYITFAKQTFTANGSTVAFTLDNSVANENELEVFVNNVRQEPGSGKAYTASGTTLTMSEAPNTGDDFYCIYQGKATQTVTPGNGTVHNDHLASGAFSNITGVGTLTTFSSTGIDDNATSTAVTIDSSENVGIGESSPTAKLHILQTAETIDDGIKIVGSSSPISGRIYMNNTDVLIDNATAGQGTGIALDSSGNIGIGTGAPSSYYANKLVVDIGSTAQSGITIVADSSNQAMLAFADGTSGDARYRGYLDYNHSNDSLAFASAGTEAMRIDNSANLKFNSGFGSVGFAYGVRAWCHFNGSGTPSIAASGNISGITDDGVGLYTLAFSNAMPDGNYVIGGTGGSGGTGDNTVLGLDNNSTSGFRLLVEDNGGNNVDRSSTVVLVVR